MGIRLQGGFSSRKEGAAYVINIHDSSYSSGIIDFELTESGLIEAYDHNEDGRNHAILTSFFEVRMLVKNANIEAFLTDVVNSAEGRFLLEIKKNGNKYWYGFIVPDLLTLRDTPYGTNPELTIKAVDGIGRLKEIDYNDEGVSYTGRETFIGHLFNLLGKIGFDSFYATSELYLVTYIDWWDQNHTYDTSTDPYELSRFDHRALIKVDSGGEVVYTSAYDVLNEIVSAWNCRFLFSDGAYRLMQINQYKTNGSTKVLRYYDKDQALTTSSTVDFAPYNRTTGNLDKFYSGAYDCYHNKGNFKFFPVLRKVEVQYEHFSTDNLIPGYTWNQGTTPTASFANVDFNGGSARLVFQSTIESRANWTDVTELQILTFWFQIQFRVGTYYLKRGYSFDGGKYTYQAFEWTTTPSFVDVFSEYMYTNNFPRYTDVSFTTPLLPEGGELLVTIARTGAYNTEGEQVFTTSSDFTPYYSWSGTSVQVYVDGNLEGQTNIKVYTATNDDGSTNSKTELLPVLVGDGPSGNTFGAIEVYDGSGWVDSTGWRKGNSGSYVDFGQLLANEIMAGQKVAIRRYIGTITGDYFAHARLRRVEPSIISNYIFLGGRHDIHFDSWEGEWFQIDVDNTGITSETPRDFGEIFRDPDFPFNKIPKGSFPKIPTGSDPPVRTYDPNGRTIKNIPIRVFVIGGVEISSIPIDGSEIENVIYAGDELEITTPTGEVIHVKVTQDVLPGDTVVNIVPITPGIDIPLGSVISVPDADLLTYAQASRLKYLKFWADIRVSDAVVDGNPLFFFRVDESSDVYLTRATGVEIQVYTPGSGAGTYDFELRRNATNILTSTVSETTTIGRETFDFTLATGLYSFHVSNITGTIPTGVNFLLSYIDLIKRIGFISPTSTIYGEYPGDVEAYAGGVLTGQLYTMSIDNYSGMPQGLVILQYNTSGYPSDSVAMVDDDAWYPVSTENAYGMKLGSVRVKNYSGTDYDDDSAAATGGIGVGEYFVLSAANPYGVAAGFIKLRIA